jgi:hypothetical protein
MSLSVNLRKKIHRKIWEAIFTPLPVVTASGMCLTKDCLNLGDGNQAYYITSTTVIYQLAAAEEGFGQIPTSGSAGTFGAGAAGFHHPTGPTGTATAGTTTSLTTTLTLPRDLRGYRIRVTGGTNAGQERIIASNTLGVNSVITVQDAFSGACDNTSVFLIFSGRLWFYVPGATSGFNYYDFATNAWTARSVASGPAITSNEGCLTGTPSQDFIVDYGNASAGGASTLTDASRAWTVNQWANTLVKIISGTGVGQYRVVTSNTATILTVNSAWTTAPDTTSVYEVGSFSAGIASAGAATTITNGTAGAATWATNMWATYQVRIVSGTGAGQVRTIASNTGNVLTVSASWTVNPDATSYFVIEGNDDSLYFLGGAAVTLFKYSISGNTWSTLSPGVARAGAAGAATSCSWISQCKDAAWTAQTGPANATTYRQNGRYLFSFRGGGTGTLDIYDIVGNTWINTVAYGGSSAETFTTGSTYADLDGFIYAQKDASGRFFRFDCSKMEMIPIGTNTLTQGAAIGGSKMYIEKYLDPTNGKALKFIYWAANTSTALSRMLEV